MKLVTIVWSKSEWVNVRKFMSNRVPTHRGAARIISNLVNEDYGHQALVVDSNGNTIADIARHEFSTTEQSYTDECITANARLIAAAPEMLAILKKWAIRVDDSCEDSFVINRTMTALEAREINAAIAKAEGRAE